MRMLSFVRLSSCTFGAILLVAAAVTSHAQYSAPPGSGDPFKDTSMLKPPDGHNVAIIEFDDLECPWCAHVAPIIHEALERYKIPYVHYDFPLVEIHIWSRQAAITARYLQDTVSPQMADQFRSEIFASQSKIESLDALDSFTKQFFQKHKLKRPFVTDPEGKYAIEVSADRSLGDRLGVRRTPTILVVTPHKWVHVTDVSQLYSVIDEALAETGSAKSSPAANSKQRRPAAPQK